MYLHSITGTATAAVATVIPMAAPLTKKKSLLASKSAIHLTCTMEIITDILTLEDTDTVTTVVTMDTLTVEVDTATLTEEVMPQNRPAPSSCTVFSFTS